MCLDSAASPEDMRQPVKIWPCHGEYGNQVCLRPPSFVLLSLCRFIGAGAHHHCKFVLKSSFWYLVILVTAIIY